jgi:predicted dehydrogenase
MLNGAIIGFGKIAQNSHIPAYRNIEATGKAKITSVVEPDENNRNQSKIKFSNIKFYPSISDLFKIEKLDFVDITTPPFSHAKILEEIVKHNVNIICEKPFTLNLQEANRISEILRKSDIVFMPCHQYKYAQLWKSFKDFIKPSENAKYIFQSGVYRTEADFGLPVFNNPWRINKVMSGGGILMDTGIHYLYLTKWLLGNINKITVQLFNLKHNYNVEDTANLLLECEHGIADITLTWGAGNRTNSASLISKCGSLIYDGKKEVKKSTNENEETFLIPDISDKASYNSLYTSLFEEFIKNVNENNKTTKYINEAVESIYLLEECYRSAREQKTIILNNK